MTAVADPLPGKLETSDDVKIAYLDRAKQTIRLIFLTGVDKGHNQEYNYSNADVDSRIRTGDAPIECIRHGETLIRLKFKPGMEPAQSAGAPVSQAKSVESAKPPEDKQKEEPKTESKPAEQKPAAPQIDEGKWKIALLKKEGNRALIRTNNGKEEWFNFSGKAAEKILRLKEGQLVKLRFENSTTFNDINPVDEKGEYDKSAWGGSGGEKRGGRPYDPTVDLIKNYSILHESVMDKAERFAEFCLMHDVTDEKREQSWEWILETTIVSSETIYKKIEEKYKYQGGQ